MNLEEKLRQVLKVNREWEVALVGAGALGTAIAHYRGFADRGFHVACVFDSAPDKIGLEVANCIIQPLEEMETTITSRDIQIAMVAVPAEYAQQVANKLIECGVRAILNYAPISLNVPEGVHVQYIDPVVHMQRMTYYLR
jgi:redox-sensing transcriptional repressor